MAKSKNTTEKTAAMLGKRKAAAAHLGLRSGKKLKTSLSSRATRRKSPRGSPSRTPRKDNQKGRKRKAASPGSMRSKRNRKESTDCSSHETSVDAAEEETSDATASNEENTSDRPDGDE